MNVIQGLIRSVQSSFCFNAVYIIPDVSNFAYNNYFSGSLVLRSYFSSWERSEDLIKDGAHTLISLFNFLSKMFIVLYKHSYLMLAFVSTYFNEFVSWFPQEFKAIIQQRFKLTFQVILSAQTQDWFYLYSSSKSRVHPRRF